MLLLIVSPSCASIPRRQLVLRLTATTVFARLDRLALACELLSAFDAFCVALSCKTLLAFVALLSEWITVLVEQ